MATFNLIPEKVENQLPPVKGQMTLFIDNAQKGPILGESRREYQIRHGT